MVGVDSHQDDTECGPIAFPQSFGTALRVVPFITTFPQSWCFFSLHVRNHALCIRGIIVV